MALNEVGGATGPNNPVAHFGIQVKSTAAVREVAARLKDAGLDIAAEENVTCCYAVQNKVWAPTSTETAPAANTTGTAGG